MNQKPKRPQRSKRKPKPKNRGGHAESQKRHVTGPRFVMEALTAGTALVLYVAPGLKDRDALVAEAERRGVKVAERDARTLTELTGGTRHQGVVAEVKDFQYVDLAVMLDKLPEQGLLVALDEIQDPHNFGAIIRSAVGFSANGLIVQERRAAPVTPVVSRTSAGATERADISQVTNLQRTLLSLSERGLEIVGLAGEGTVSIDSLGPPPPEGRVLVVGSEGRGLRRMVRERCDTLARIPHDGPVESLNASVAAGIALYAATRWKKEDHGHAQEELKEGSD